MSNEAVQTAVKRRKRKVAFSWLAAAVAVTTVAALVMPATTTEYAPACGFEEHTHTEECYATETRLICPLEENEGHIHTEECFLSNPGYICGLEESEGHVHGEECRATETVLLCGLEDDPEHEHTEDCYGERWVTVCGLDEDPEHIHGAECYEYICGLEESEGHTHGEGCLDPNPVPVCGLEAGAVHEHTADCIEWEETFVCGLEEDPEHVHTEECIVRTPRFICEVPAGYGHIHNEYCYETVEVLVCGKEEHVHTDECYPKLTGDPHADVEISLDWESTLINTELTGIWSDDLVAVARSQAGYRESELNFITDAYNVKRGYTRYGEWYGNPYEDWNGLFVMFCLHYAGINGVPVDPSPARWITTAADQGLLREAEEAPVPGDIAFCDDDGDGLIDRAGIVSALNEIETEEGPDTEITLIMGQRQQGVGEEFFTLSAGHIAAYLALPENPEPRLTPEEVQKENAVMTAAAGEAIPEADIPLTAGPTDVLLTADTGFGITATLFADAGSFSFPAEELVLKISEVEDGNGEAEDASDPYDSAVQSIDSLLAPDGMKAAETRLFEISIWHKEFEPAADAEGNDGTAGENEAPAEEDFFTAEDFFTTEDEFAAFGPFEMEGFKSDADLPADPEPTEEMTPAEDPQAQEATNDPEQAAAEPEQTTAEPEQDAEGEPEERPYTLVEILPLGPVQVTVEGIETEDGADCRVYRVNEFGEVTELTPDAFRRGSVTVTTEAF